MSANAAEYFEELFTMPSFLNLPPFTEDGDVHVVIETRRGSRAKFAYDPKLESFALAKSLLTDTMVIHDGQRPSG